MLFRSLPMIGRPCHSLVTSAVMISGRLIRTLEPSPAKRAYATIAPITSVSDRFGGVVGESAADGVKDAAAEGLANRALPACATVETDSVVVVASIEA